MAVDDIYLLCHINFAQAKCSKCGKELKGMDAAQVVDCPADRKVSGLLLGSSSLCVKLALGKMLKPKLSLMRLSACVSL